MPRQIDATLVLDARARLGECPVWDDRAGALRWVDISAGRLHRFAVAGGDDDDVRDLGQPVGALACREGEGLVLALRDGFALLDDDDAPVRLVAPVEEDLPHHRMNDGACDPRGRFWAGTASTRGEPASGTLYRLEADGTVEAMIRGVGMSNGIGWGPGGRSMYYVDSLSQRLDVCDFDPDTGAVGRRRPLAAIDPAVGIPDGLAVDVDGGVWLALWGAGRVVRYTPDGGVDAEVRVPVSRVTSCAFGGEDLGDLYITSASEGRSPQEGPLEQHAGGVFVARPGTRGVAAARFAG